MLPAIIVQKKKKKKKNLKKRRIIQDSDDESDNDENTTTSSNKMVVLMETCTICKRTKKKLNNFFPNDNDSSSSTTTSSNICLDCIGPLVGATQFPSCRFCGELLNSTTASTSTTTSSKCNCYEQRRLPSKTCSFCHNSFERDEYTDHQWFHLNDDDDDGGTGVSSSSSTGENNASSSSSSRIRHTTKIRRRIVGNHHHHRSIVVVCMACMSKEELFQEQWIATGDRNSTFQLLRHGIQMYDCDPFLRLLLPNTTDQKFQSLPSVKDLVGTYDLVFTEWKTLGTNSYSMAEKMSFGDALLKRTISGSLQLTSSSSSATCSNNSDADDDDHISLEGRIDFDKCIYEDNQSGSDIACNYPYENTILFRFSGDDVDSFVEDRYMEATSEDDSDGSVLVVSQEDLQQQDTTTTTAIPFETLAQSSLWRGSYGAEVSLQVVGERHNFPWIPRDYLREDNTYSRVIRQEIQQRHDQYYTRANDDGGYSWAQSSWLHCQMYLPEPIVLLIYTFITNCPQPNLVIERNDLLLSFEVREYDSSLEAKIFARKRI